MSKTRWIGLWIACCFATLPAVAVEGDKCWSCHATGTPGIVAQWKASKHFDEGVTCIDCHAAAEDDVDDLEARYAFHRIMVLVSGPEQEATDEIILARHPPVPCCAGRGSVSNTWSPTRA